MRMLTECSTSPLGRGLHEALQFIFVSRVGSEEGGWFFPWGEGVVRAVLVARKRDAIHERSLPYNPDRLRHLIALMYR